MVKSGYDSVASHPAWCLVVTLSECWLLVLSLKFIIGMQSSYYHLYFCMRLTRRIDTEYSVSLILTLASEIFANFLQPSP